VEPKGRTQEAQTITSQQIYPQLLANSNCRQWKGIIVVDQMSHSPQNQSLTA
jgi:hypothetical protein